MLRNLKSFATLQKCVLSLLGTVSNPFLLDSILGRFCLDLLKPKLTARTGDFLGRLLLLLLESLSLPKLSVNGTNSPSFVSSYPNFCDELGMDGMAGMIVR